MDDALRMSARDRVEHLGHQVQRFPGRERPFVREDFLERLPGDVVEDDEETPVIAFTRVDQADDVRMGKRRAELHLAPEPFALDVNVPRSVGFREAESLDGDILTGRQLTSLVHTAEGAGAELGQHLVSVLKTSASRKFVARHTVGCVRGD